jgi:hypothetical protein
MISKAGQFGAFFHFAGRGLGQAQRLLNFAYAQRAALEQLDHFHPIGVGEGFHHLYKFTHRGLHIDIWRYIVSIIRLSTPNVVASAVIGVGAA